MSHGWCEALGIEGPRLEEVKDHREAVPYSLLLVALLEQDGPMTLQQVADRFAQAGVATAERALMSLKRCKPGRAPVYRDGDLYHLEPHDADLSLWVFRLGLRPPRIPRLAVVRSEPEPLPGPEEKLSVAALDEAFHQASLNGWSQQHLTLAVLDAHDGPMSPAEVVAFVAQRTRWHLLREDTPSFGRRNSSVEVLPDGRWAIGASSGASLRKAREAVRARQEMVRRHGAGRFDPAVTKATIKAAELARAARAAELAKLRRGLLYAFPETEPLAVALLDLDQRRVTTFVGDELPELHRHLADLELIGAIDVRALLRTLGFEPEARRLAELGPPQKTMSFDRGRFTLKLDVEMLVTGSCGIRRPFGDPEKLAEQLSQGRDAQLRRRLVANVEALLALYEYGRLHGMARIRRGGIDERVPVPWGNSDEPRLYERMKTAADAGVPIEVVVGDAPDFADPWARAQLAYVLLDDFGLPGLLLDERGQPIDEADVQLARVPTRSG